MMALFGIDEIDLKRGEGEWTNMQPVVRKSFTALFNVIATQQQQITELTDTVSKLKREIDKKPDVDSISRQIADSRIIIPDVLKRGDLAGIHSLLVDVKAEVERKASIRYVDDACRRKIDKSDVTMRPLLQNAEHMSKLSVDIANLKQHVEKYEHIPAQISEIKAKAASKEDVKNVLSRIDHLAQSISERPDCETIHLLLREKANVKEIDGRVDLILNNRHDEAKAELEALDRMSIDHERRISSIEYSAHRQQDRQPSAVRPPKQSEASRQLNHYGKVISQNVASMTGSRATDIYESRRAAQIDYMQEKLDDTSSDVREQAKLCAELKSRVQRLEGHVTKISEETRDKYTSQQSAISDLHHRMRELKSSSATALDEVENRVASLHHKVESGLFEPLSKRVEAIEFKSETMNLALETLQKEIQETANTSTTTAGKIKNIENAVVSFNEGVMADVKKELHRMKTDKTAATIAIENSTKGLRDQQHAIELRMHDLDATLRTQLDLSASKFASIGDLAVTVRTLKQTVKTIIDTTLQQNKKLQSFEVHREKSDDTLRSQLAVDLNSRLHNCETALSKLNDLELRSAVNVKSISSLENDMKETKKMTNNFQVQFSELNTIARSLRAAHISAHNSSSIAQAATAVVEGLAADIAHHNRSHQVAAADLIDIDRKDPSVSDWKHRVHGIHESFHASANHHANMSMQTKIDQLREEKERLVRELYGGKD